MNPDDLNPEESPKFASVVDEICYHLLNTPGLVQTVSDPDGDTDFTLTEGGGALGGDIMTWTVDGVVVGSVELLAGSIPKWTLNGVVDPIAFVGAQTNCTTITTIVGTGSALYVSDGTDGFVAGEWVKYENTVCSAIAGGGGGGATNLSYTASTRLLESDTGTDVTLPEVVAAGDSGLMTGADKTKLNALESLYTADGTIPTRGVTLTGNLSITGAGGSIVMTPNGDLQADRFFRVIDASTATLTVTPDLSAAENYSYDIDNSTVGNITLADATGSHDRQLWLVHFENTDTISRTIDFGASYVDKDNIAISSITLAAGETTSLAFITGLGSKNFWVGSTPTTVEPNTMLSASNGLHSALIQTNAAGTSVSTYIQADTANRALVRVTDDAGTFLQVQGVIPALTSISITGADGGVEDLFTTGTDVIPTGTYFVSYNSGTMALQRFAWEKEHVETFVVGDWVTVGDNSTFSIAVADHDQGPNPDVKVQEGATAPYEDVITQVTTAADGSITLTIAAGEEFDGRVIIQ